MIEIVIAVYLQTISIPIDTINDSVMIWIKVKGIFSRVMWMDVDDIIVKKLQYKIDNLSYLMNKYGDCFLFIDTFEKTNQSVFLELKTWKFDTFPKSTNNRGYRNKN